MNKIVLFFITLTLFGCATYGPESPAWNKRFITVWNPSPENDYVGRIGAEPFTDPRPDIRVRCFAFGGLDESSVVKLPYQEPAGVIGIHTYEYTCNKKAANNPPATIPFVHRDDTQKDSDALRAKSDGGGGYAPSSEDKSNSSNQLPLPQVKDLSIAKKQCEELGFKPKTEKFGKCVLELSK